MTSPDEPERYLHGHHESVLRSHTWRTAENSAGYLLPYLDFSARVLDVGCGPGTITIDLAARVGEILGIDTSPDVIDQAAKGLHAPGAPSNCTFAVGDVFAIDAPDGSFDVVHSHQVLQHLTRPVEALEEMRRVLRPGGVLGVRDADYGNMTWTPATGVLQEWNDLYRATARKLGAEPDAGRHLQAWADTAGFDDVLWSHESWIFTSAEERSWWGGLWADRTQESSFAVHAVESGLAKQTDLERLAAGWREWIYQPDATFECPHGQIIARRAG